MEKELTTLDIIKKERELQNKARYAMCDYSNYLANNKYIDRAEIYEQEYDIAEKELKDFQKIIWVLK